MQIKQTNEQPNKEEEVDSESYFMPILHIPTKDQRKLLQSSVPAQMKQQHNRKENVAVEKIVEEKLESKRRGLRLNANIEKVQNKEDQTVQKKEGKRAKREIIKKEAIYKKEIKIQNSKKTLPLRIQKRGRPKKELKIKRQIRGQKLQEGSKINKKNKSGSKITQLKQVQQQAKQQRERQKIQIQNQLQFTQKKHQQIRLEQPIKHKETKTSLIEKKQNSEFQRKQEKKQENQVPRIKKENIQKETKKLKKRRQSSSDSSSDSDSSDSHRRHKTKKIKLHLTNHQKMLIWKNRYLRCRQKLKQNFFQYKRCPRRHLMRNLIHDPDKSAYRLVCQKCNKDLQRNCLVYWQCDPCRYIVCAKCQGFNWKKCPYGHPIMKSQHFRGQKICDICLEHRYVGGLTCPCNFDMCGNCQLKAKRFNEKGQEIISLQSQE